MVKKAKLSIEKQMKVEGYVFVAPFIIGILIFFIYPVFISLRLSFGKVERLAGFQIIWAGFTNYINALFVETSFVPLFLEVVKSTFLKIPLIIVFSFILAVMINKKIRFRGFFRFVFFLPFILGTGFVLEQLNVLGVQTKALSLESSIFITPSMIAYLGPEVSEAVNGFLNVIVQVLWSCSVQILLFLSGLQSISPSLYESASVDGATEWEKFWKITLPMCTPVMVINIIYTITDGFTSITNPMTTYINNFAFKARWYEYSAAVSWLYTAFVFVLIIIVILLFGRNYGSDTTRGGMKVVKRKSTIK